MKIGLWIAMGLLATSARAEPLAVGDRIASFSLEDQHGKAHAVDGAVDAILFSRDMDGGDVVKRALADAPRGLLASGNAIFIADINGMPGIVARLFAIPSMRKRNYPILLDRDGSSTARLPHIEGHTTLIFVDDLEITRVLHLADHSQVREEIEKLGNVGGR